MILIKLITNIVVQVDITVLEPVRNLFYVFFFLDTCSYIKNHTIISFLIENLGAVHEILSRGEDPMRAYRLLLYTKTASICSYHTSTKNGGSNVGLCYSKYRGLSRNTNSHGNIHNKWDLVWSAE